MAALAAAPTCAGMKVVCWAEEERGRLAGHVHETADRFKSDEEEQPTMTTKDSRQVRRWLTMYATDVVQLHILRGLAVTAGSAFGYDPPDRQTCWQEMTTAGSEDDRQTIQLHRGGKAFTKHAHRASSGWSVPRPLSLLCHVID